LRIQQDQHGGHANCNRVLCLDGVVLRIREC
jgi:hypothetical protein